MNALDPAAPGFATLLGALLGAAAAGSFAADTSPRPAATSASESAAPTARDSGAMMKECIAREQKKPGTDHAAAEVSCRGQGEAHQAAQSQEKTEAKHGADDASASGHSSHSGVSSSQQRATDPVPLAPTAEGKSTRPKTAR